MKISRLLWLLCPLIAVAVASAPEWPARAQMLQAPWRDAVLPVATQWAAVARPWESSVPASTSPPLVAALPAPRVVATPAVNPPAAITQATVVPPSVTPDVAVSPATVTHEQLTQAAQAGVAAAMGTYPVVASAPQVEAATAAASATPAVARVKSGTVLLVGDSLMGEVARGLRQGLPRAFSLVDKHRSSTGLTNSGYYDWPGEAAMFTTQTQPDWVVIHMGANDAQDMLLDGHWVHFGAAQWEAQYQARAEAMIDNVRAQAPNATILWLGLPAMRSPGFDTKMVRIARLQAAAASSRGVTYLDGRQALGTTYAKDGQGRDGRRHIWRADDGIHYSREGGYRLAEEVGTFPSVGWPWNAGS